jgi:TusA-related sulfurtransferase
VRRPAVRARANIRVPTDHRAITRDTMQVDKEIDASGQVLRVLGTGPGTLDDMPAFAQSGGYMLISASEEGDRFVFLIRKA